jgi:MFS transporter, DHA2 family, multidrug resistance protein
VAFFGWEFRSNSPFIRVRAFVSHNLRFGAFLGFILGIPLFGGATFLQYLQNGLSFTPGLAGAELALRVVTILVTIPFVAYALSKDLVDVRYFIVPGFILVAISYWMLYWHTTYLSDFGSFVAPFVLQGFAFSLLFSPIIRTVLTSLPPEEFTHGVAIFKLTLVTGGSFASALLSYVIDHRATLHFSQITEGINLAEPAFFTYLSSPFPHPLIVLADLAQQQSYISAYADANLYVAILALCVAPLALLLRPPPRRL